MPMHSNCNKIPATGSKVYTILQNNFTNINQVIINNAVEIVEHLLFSLWDKQLFQQYFNVDIDIETDDLLIDYNSFIKCIEYLQVCIFL